MITIWVGNLITRKKWPVYFDSPYKARMFINKCKHSNKIIVLSVEGMLDD